MFYIRRNTKEYGPLSAEKVKVGCISGKIHLLDLIRHENTQKYIPVNEFLELNNIQIQQEEEQLSDVFFNFFKLQTVFINPFKYIGLNHKDNTVLYIFLAIILIPFMGLLTRQIPLFSYCVFGFYFASIWALILYKVIGTKQTDLKKSLSIGLLTIIASIIVITLFHQTSIWTEFTKFINSDNFVVRFIGMLVGVSLLEEGLKQVFVYITINKGKEITLPRTAIFYGMIAGLAFGIFEGVEYQVGLNKTLNTDDNYFLNIIRLTSLPFFHAIWAGIGGYFASLSFLELKYKYSFRLMGLFIPATLHALYNTFGLNIFGILTLILSAILLTIYLTKNDLVVKQIIDL